MAIQLTPTRIKGSKYLLIPKDLARLLEIEDKSVLNLTIEEMGLLPEFFTLLGIEIFAAMSLMSVLLDRDIPSSAQWLFQGAAGLGLGQLVVTEGFGTNSVIDSSRFWISIFYLTLSICSVAGLNVYLGAVRRKTAIASVFSGTITAPTASISALFVSSYLSGVDVSVTPLTSVRLVVPALVVGLCT